MKGFFSDVASAINSDENVAQMMDETVYLIVELLGHSNECGAWNNSQYVIINASRIRVFKFDGSTGLCVIH